MSFLRSCLAYLTRNSPLFKGKGRVVLLLERALGMNNSAPIWAVGTVNELALMKFDLRAWGQKFAYYYGVWEKEYVDFSRRLYNGGDFVDVGSSLGLYVICLGDLVRSANSRILSVEPLPFNLVKQKENIRLNGLEGCVDFFPIALADRETVLRISSDADESDNNGYIASDGAMEVRVTTLDLLLAASGTKRIGFIKIDVEGFDSLVIIGAAETIRRDHPVIFAEFNRERMSINSFDISLPWELLKSEGYRAFRVLDGDLVELDAPGEVENIFFIPPKVGGT